MSKKVQWAQRVEWRSYCDPRFPLGSVFRVEGRDPNDGTDCKTDMWAWNTDYREKASLDKSTLRLLSPEEAVLLILAG